MGDVGDAIAEARREVSEAASDILPRVCTILAPTQAPSGDGYGEQGEATQTEIVNVPCSFKAMSAFERNVASGTLAGSDHKFKLPYFISGSLLDIPATATIRVEADAPYPARTFRVTGPLEDSDELWQYVAATVIQ